MPSHTGLIKCDRLFGVFRKEHKLDQILYKSDALFEAVVHPWLPFPPSYSLCVSTRLQTATR
jgi:hypothetical protein